jgi:hypothetical protein
MGPFHAHESGFFRQSDNQALENIWPSALISIDSRESSYLAEAIAISMGLMEFGNC